MHLYRQETMIDPPVKNPLPAIYNLYIDPREEKPTVATWVVHPMLHMIEEFNASVKRHPLIPMGTPDPYVPPKKTACQLSAERAKPFP